MHEGSGVPGNKFPCEDDQDHNRPKLVT